ncbi:Alpha/Beta hydrolase protein [Schizophyllum amplum]|uniref:Alpha/Beta hydrolase protein n=1 Tax=Schizophyllum amplum TaxID=97359 RepID=A0A550CX61_9AGAR|nr:Alpha/Beta hydrolase protein [Auriculariopsis ampla]
MIDHLVGRPSPSWKRTQVFLVIFFWLWQVLRGSSRGPRIQLLRRLNERLGRFTPWQLIVSVLTGVYAVRNFDKILGLAAPEPLARLYSPSYYRATWLATGLDAGFATAMCIKPRWLRHICSVLFSGYYIIYANEADEKLRKFRAVPTVEMLRATWEKTANPILRAFMHFPSVSLFRKVLIQRPNASSYTRPITTYLFFAPPSAELADAVDLILDFPGGGFVAMSPLHHQERLRMWTISSKRPVLSVDYGKAPEYPYPFAIDEVFDLYRALVDTNGANIGMSGKKLNIIISGDSAGATLAVSTMVKILEYNARTPQQRLPIPVALVLNYAALDFNFTSWMSDEHLKVLRSEQSSGNFPGLHDLVAQKDHLKHVSPLSMVGDSHTFHKSKKLRRRASWRDALRNAGDDEDGEGTKTIVRHRRSTSALKHPVARRHLPKRATSGSGDEKGSMADGESSDEENDEQAYPEEERPLEARVKYVYSSAPSRPPPPQRSDSVIEKQQKQLSKAVEEADVQAAMSIGKKGSGSKNSEPIGTRLTMTSRTGYFQDRIISPSMMRAMAILYIGPHRNPDFRTDYHISPILTPDHLLAQFPPLLMQCGEKDPFVDDTVIFAGRVREAKRARKVELDLALSGKSARFGESLRMSDADAASRDMAALKRERAKLAAETDDDWVQMVLFSDWSHGYLQMPALMTEAAAVIEELAEWIDETFAHYTAQSSVDLSEARPDRFAASALSASETETDTDSTITFVPKKYANSRTYSMSSDRAPRVSQSPARAGNAASPSRPFKSEDGGGRVEPPALPHQGSYHPDLQMDFYGVLSEDVDGGYDNPEGTKSRPAGQTITESELLRRRRLLDSHIFE